MPARQQFIKRTVCGLVLLWLLGAPLRAYADHADDYITSQMREQHIPGISVAVIKNGRIIKSQGYGLANVEMNTPAAAATVYPLASLTKQFTAAAIMLLVQDGKVGIDDKISRYLGDIPVNWQDVTIRQLLTHTSGIKDYLNEMRSSTCNGTSPEEIISGIGKMPLNFAPGSELFYSNTGYLVLGLIVHKVSGKRYDEFLTERVFKPLGMNQTRRDSPDDIIPNRAAGYVWAEGKLHNSPFIAPTLYNNADAGLLSSVPDLARWDAALYGDSILSLSSRTQMWLPVKLIAGSTRPFGFGWELEDVNGHRLVYHNGNRPDSSTFIARYVDDKLTVIVLTNRSDANPSRITRHLAGLFVPALVYDKPMADKEPQVTAMLKAVLLKIQDGTIDSISFTPEMWSGFYPNAVDYVQHLLKSAGTFKSIILLSQREQDGKRFYRYRAVFGETSLLIDCTLTKEGKISDMGIEPG